MNYKTIYTKAGLKRLAAAQQSGDVIGFSAMAVGDGNGNPVTPSENQTGLVREVYRATVNRVWNEDKADLTRFSAELVVPASQGGFTVREIALFDEDGAMFAVGNVPPSYKPLASEGAFGDAIYRIQFVAANASTIALQVDPNVAVATRSWVLNAVDAAQIIPGGTTGQILAKSSNADGDVEWTDPTAVNVTVDCIEETQTLAENQTVVNLAVVTTTGLAVYVAGQRLRKDEWAISADKPSTQIVLAKSYAKDTRIVLAQNEPNGGLDLGSYVRRDGTTTMTGGLAVANTAGDAIRITTPSGVSAIIRLKQAGQGGGSVKSLAGGALAIGADTASGDTERVRVDGATGYVGIGTSDPKRALHVAGSARLADGGALEFGGASAGISGSAQSNSLSGMTGGATRFTVNADGNFGIGVAAPAYRLDVAGSARLDAANGGALAAAYAGTIMGDVGADSVGFYVNSTTKRTVLNPNGGNVGVGVSAPGAKLHVNGEAWTSGNMTAGYGTNTAAGIEIGGDRVAPGTSFLDLHAAVGTDYDARLIRASGANGDLGLWNTGTGSMIFRQYGAAPITFETAAGERMRISPSGTVAIGTAAPANGVALQVAGGPIQLDTIAGPQVTGLVGGGGATDAFTYDGDKRLAHYGLAWKSFTGASEAAAALTAYGGIRLFTTGAERLRLTQQGAFIGGELGAGALTDAPGVLSLMRNAIGDGSWLEFTNRGTVAPSMSAHEVGGMYGRGWRDVLDPAYIAGISFLRTASNNGYSSSGSIVFKTDVAGVRKADLPIRMIINGGGDVGIGTDTPLSSLNVTRVGSVNQSNLFRWTDAANSTGYLSVRSSNGPGVGIGSDGHIAFSINQGGSGVFSEAARLHSNGAFGIGISNPQVALHLGSTQDEIIRIQKTNGFIGFFNTANTGRFGYVQGTEAGLIIGSDAGLIQLGGTVTHPTPGLGAAGTESINAAWFRNQYQQSFATAGYTKLPNGLILQWGSGTFYAGAVITFPIAFPNACTAVVGTDSAGVNTFSAQARSTSSFRFASSANPQTISYIAIGF